MDDASATWLNYREVLAAHADFGRLDWHMVKKAMGPNWPADWERLGPGNGIFEPEKSRSTLGGGHGEG